MNWEVYLRSEYERYEKLESKLTEDLEYEKERENLNVN